MEYVDIARYLGALLVVLALLVTVQAAQLSALWSRLPVPVIPAPGDPTPSAPSLKVLADLPRRVRIGDSHQTGFIAGGVVLSTAGALSLAAPQGASIWCWSIVGAVALGDIGMHFPDTDPRWKGADSLQFLSHAVELAKAKGFQLVNVDSTVILERPKLKDYRFAIRERLAATMGIDLDCVSVKFKTAEKVGPVGEGRSAEAQAIVTVEQG